MEAIIRFIESNKEPYTGDLVKSVRGWIGVFGQHENPYPAECTVVYPYGITEEEIKMGDLFIYGEGDEAAGEVGVWDGVTYLSDEDKKVVLVPTDFNNQVIADLGLKDGDHIHYDWYVPQANGQISHEISLNKEEDILLQISKVVCITPNDMKNYKEANRKTWFENNSFKGSMLGYHLMGCRPDLGFYIKVDNLEISQDFFKEEYETIVEAYHSVLDKMKEYYEANNAKNDEQRN
jgi:hypothetical protein